MSGQLKILTVGDLHVGDSLTQGQRDDVFAGIEQASRDCDFVMLLGDNTNTGMPGEYRELKHRCKKLRVPVFGIRGNHDRGSYYELCQWLMPEDANSVFLRSESPLYIWNFNWWEQVNENAITLPGTINLPEPYRWTAQPPVVKLIDGLGPYYSFDRSGYHLVALDTCTAALKEKQVEWLSQDLLANAGKPTVIFIHATILPTGSHVDSAILWDREPVIELVRRSKDVIGVFSAHVHRNRVWDFEGTKIVVTGARDCRVVVLDDGQVSHVDLLEDYESLEEPFAGRYFLPSQTLCPCFRCTASDVWNFSGSADRYGSAGWVSDEAAGGLVWALHITEEQALGPAWVGLSFKVQSSWQLTISDPHGRTILEREGTGGAVNLSEKVNFPASGKYLARLKEDAPAMGHACPYLSIGEERLNAVNLYPDIVP